MDSAALSALGLPISGVRVDHLSLQVRQRNGIVVDDAERADTGGGKILQNRRAEAAGADDKNARGLQLLLTRPADLRQDDVARVALDFFWIEGLLCVMMAECHPETVPLATVR